MFKDYMINHKDVAIPVITGLIAFVLGLGLENKADLIPSDSKPVAAVQECSSMIPSVPMEEVTVYSPHYAGASKPQ